MRKVNKVLYILGAISVLLMLLGIAVMMCAGFMVESGDLSVVTKTVVIGIFLCVPCVVMRAVIK